MNNLKSLKKAFKNKDLFEHALTHRSWINENPGIRTSNERLEFLGDAVLEYVVSSHLYKAFTDQEEGFLTALRANIVNTKNLSELAHNLEIGDSIYLSRGEEQGGGRNNPSLLADTAEAIIGALYLDQGLDKASAFISNHLLNNLDIKLAQPLKDPKSRLQEEVQSKGMPTPRYSLVNAFGPDHAKEFMVEVKVGEKILGEGKGKSKNQAEQAAAENALVKIQA